MINYFLIGVSGLILLFLLFFPSFENNTEVEIINPENIIEVDKLIKKLKNKSIHIDYFFNRELVYIKVEDFKEFEKYFPKPIKIGKKLNHRSNHFFKHIHVVKNDELAQFHIDYGNTYKNLFLSIPHFFIDVIPYSLDRLIKLEKFHKFLSLKEIEEINLKNLNEFNYLNKTEEIKLKIIPN